MGGLKPSVIFTPDSAAPQLADTATRRSLRLTPTEARVLVKFDGSQTAKELALWAANEGLAVGAQQVQVVLERIERAGFLLAAPHIPAQDAGDVGFGPADDPLSLTHIVPSMRNDLKVAPTAGSRSTFQVSDTVAHRSFTLFDFEVSIARMLDGRRTAAQVLEASAKIGITVTLEGLRQFLLQLKAYHFLSSVPADLVKRGPQSTWPLRAEWTEDLRQLFQNALRLLRSGRLPEAREYLLAMLEIDPMNKEAQEAKTRVEELLREPLVELTFAELHREPASATGALLDSHRRVPVALEPDEPVEAPAAPSLPPAVPVGARPTAPAPRAPPPLLEVRPEPAAAPPPPSRPPPPPPPSPSVAVAAPPRVEVVELPLEEVADASPMPSVIVADVAPEEIAAALPSSDVVAGIALEPPPADAIAGTALEPPPSDIVAGTALEPTLEGAAPSVDLLAVTAPPRPAELDQPPARRSRWPRVVIVLLLAAVAGLLAVPLPRAKVIPCELSLVPVATVVVPRAGTLGELKVTDGQTVEKGALLATLSAKESQAELERLRARATTLQQRLDELAKNVQPAKVEKARAALAAKTRELEQATEHRRRVGAKHGSAAAIAHAEKEVRAKQGEVDKATKELGKLTQETKLASARSALEAVKKQTAQLEEEIAAARIVAPEAGRLVGLAAAGAELADHAELARLVAPSTLAVVARNPGLATSVDPTGATLSSRAGPGVPVSDLHWVKDAPEPLLIGTLPAAGLAPGPATLKVPLGKRPWALELVERAEALLRRFRQGATVDPAG